MNIMKFVNNFFGKKESDKNAPFIIINKEPAVIEYDNIEVAISQLEKDPDIPKHKLERMRASFEELKCKGKIRIKNGEIIN